MNQQLLVRIAQIFGQLNSPISLLDESGLSLIPRGDRLRPLPAGLEDETPIRFQDSRFLKISGQRYILEAPEDTPDDLMFLAARLVETLLQSEAQNGSITSAYQRMLQNDLSVAEQEVMISEYHIPEDLPRCVLLLHMMQVQGRTAAEILSEIIPLSAGDVLVPMDHHAAALIKCTAEIEEIDDLQQLAGAIQDTVLDETGTAMMIGIGGEARQVGDLHQSYRQARRAIEIGRIFRPEKTVFIYSSLLLERFLSDIPPETAAHYHNLLFNPNTSRLFSEEILQTVEMFFRKDLNLSDTARQLYIHRNTLVYRLDKIQRQTGLDLRRFDDAVTFKMLLEMRKCAENTTKITL